MEASIDNTKRDLHNWIMDNRGHYMNMDLQITGNSLNMPYMQIQLNFLMERKIKFIELYLEPHIMENAQDILLQEIIEINNHIKQLLGL